MRTLRCALFTLLTTFVVAAPVVAEESPLYAGLRVGSLSADLPGLEDTAAIALTFGYDVRTDPNGALAVEAEISRTITDGDISGGGGWDARTAGAYAAYRTAGAVYVKAKAGYLDQSINQSGGSTLNADDAGFTYGAGGGWRINSKAGLELEYTSMSDDLRFLSLAYVTHF